MSMLRQAGKHGHSEDSALRLGPRRRAQCARIRRPVQAGGCACRLDPFFARSRRPVRPDIPDPEPSIPGPGEGDPNKRPGAPEREGEPAPEPATRPLRPESEL